MNKIHTIGEDIYLDMVSDFTLKAACGKFMKNSCYLWVKNATKKCMVDVKSHSSSKYTNSLGIFPFGQKLSRN
tara:strand:+ start:1270 stop:1488 length:219 start_codon:yes stop_codon:yes gene_type:complete